MAIDFSATDIFNKEQQFSRIEWGAEAPVLEVELNELQKIQNYKRNISSQKLVGDIDGFFTAGTMTYSSGTLTVPADTIIANGEVLEILGAMTLSGLVNGDTVKLHVFETEVTKDTSLVKSGNLSGGASISNGIQDSRIGMETSRRIQKQVQLVKTAIPDPIPAGEAYMTVATIGTSNNFIDTRVKVPTTAGLNTLLDNHKVDYTLQVPYGGTTTNISNAYSIANPPIDSLVAGMAICIKVNANSSGPTTLNWNGKGAASILKSNGFAVSNLKAGGIYTLRYDGTNFILQGEGASGNATASDLLSGKTASVDAGDIVGTIPSKAAQTYTPGKYKQTIGAGQYLSGEQTIAGDADLIPSNIKTGVNIFGVAGTFALIKNIQYVSIQISSGNTNTATITPVDVDNTILLLNGTESHVDNPAYGLARVELISTNTVRAIRNSSGTAICRINCIVLEFWPGVVKSKQSGTCSCTYSENSLSISEVNVSKTLVAYLGLTSATTTTISLRDFNFRIYFSNSTTLVFDRYEISPDAIVGWNLIEFN